MCKYDARFIAGAETFIFLNNAYKQHNQQNRKQTEKRTGNVVRLAVEEKYPLVKDRL